MEINTKVSRRHVCLTAAAVMTPATTLAASIGDATHLTLPDPVFAAIERHRQAVQAWQAAPSETHEDDEISNQLLKTADKAWRAWLTTPPTTIAGAIATLEHASQRPYASEYPNDPDDYICTNLAEAADCLDDTRKIGEHFPQMIADALRKL